MTNEVFNKKPIENKSLNFGYKIIETLSIEDGINHLLNLPRRIDKNGNMRSSRKYKLAQMAKISTKCKCCDLEGTKFCLGIAHNNAQHWDLYSEDGTAMSVDHIDPKSKGGLDHISNLQILCVKCNWFKSNIPERLIAYKILLQSGFNVEAIHQKRCYFRIGYWKRIDYATLEAISEYVDEEEFYDEDCGYLYVYYLKK
jgi:hypothetical protein